MTEPENAITEPSTHSLDLPGATITYERPTPVRGVPLARTRSMGSRRGRGAMTPRRIASHHAFRLNPKWAMHSVTEWPAS
jgi:hypothetical protein